MKVVVFGGSGFLGSHVADKLHHAGYEVVIFDAKDSAYKKEGQEIIIGDILNLDQVVNAVKGATAVFNFAGIADIDEAKNLPIETVKYNILGNVNILEACRLASVKRFIFASTMYVYSKTGSFYRASKQASEDYVETYAQTYGLDYTILRYGSLYGGRADKRNGIFRFVESAIKNDKIVYKGDLKAKREYIHVEDAALASVEILKSEYINQNIILTGSQLYEVGDVLKMIKEMLHKNVDIISEDPGLGSSHYIMTPYSFNPKPGRKMVPQLQVDLGQGLLGVMEEIYHSDKNK
ncbi:MAG: NAD(P)-dependent oxidoreductase [Bacteriovorax sp.]|nr:NAD(P)-dependent oxidoreductase [Bacteriovorax sp.]